MDYASHTIETEQNESILVFATFSNFISCTIESGILWLLITPLVSSNLSFLYKVGD